MASTKIFLLKKTALKVKLKFLKKKIKRTTRNWLVNPTKFNKPKVHFFVKRFTTVQKKKRKNLTFR